MKTRRIDNNIERRIVTGMIVSDEFLKDVRAIYADDLLVVPYARIVARWCLDYGEQYGRAPGRHIADIFAGHRRNGLGEDNAELIAEFLAGLSEEYEHAEAGKFNSQYLLDQTEARFEARNQELVLEDIAALHARGDYRAAEDVLKNYKKVSRPAADGVEPLTDVALIQKAFDEDDARILFRLPGALGELVGPVERGDFVGLMGMEKIGKSWRLLDIALRALREGCNVAYFDAGDMNAEQITRRIHTRISGQSPKYWGRMKSPVLDCARSQDDTCRNPARVSRRGCTEEKLVDGKLVRARMDFAAITGYTPCSVCARDAPREFRGAVWYEWIETDKLDWRRAVEVGKRFAERSRKRFKLSCHANSTLTIAAVDAQLDRWEQEDGFVADVVIADYMDIFDTENEKVVEERHRQNDRWKAGRRLTQERHCALVAATQAAATSYDRKSLKLKDFSEAKAKYAHVTKFVFLNQTPEEKKDMVIRMALALAREDDFDIRDEVVVAQNLRIGQPYVFSYRT